MAGERIPAYPGPECADCGHFCLDPLTSPPFGELCFGRQSQENIGAYLSFIGLMPRPLIMPDDEIKADNKLEKNTEIVAIPPSG